MGTVTSAVTFDAVLSAAWRIAAHVHRTPLMTSATLDDQVGCHVVFKCENLQKVGAFKARGACNAVFSLTPEEAVRGVVTHSSGNHGQALAYAAARRDIPCRVVMPRDATPVKRAAVAGYGATIVDCDRSERQAVADAVVAETGGVFVHPYEDPRVIAGQGTAALELLEEIGDAGDVAAVVAPVGGGGLLSGTAIATAARCPDAEVIGAEPAAADDARRSLETGQRQPAVADPATIADGLLTGIGARPFAILRAAGAEVVTVDEDEIVAAARFHLERMKLVVEPSGATGLAAVRRVAPRFAGRTLGVIVSGGNTDLAWLR